VSDPSKISESNLTLALGKEVSEAGPSVEIHDCLTCQSVECDGNGCCPRIKMRVRGLAGRGGM
jgi:hypothetical protein